MKTYDSIYDGFNFAENMINREQNEIKTIVIICQSTASYVLLDYVCNYFLCTIYTKSACRLERAGWSGPFVDYIYFIWRKNFCIKMGKH